MPQRRIERRLPPYQSGALPLDDCGQSSMLVLAGGLEPPPLAYKASALPDELSQLLQIDKKIAAPLPVWKRACLNGPEIRRRVQFWTFTMSKSAAPTGTVVMRKRTHGQGHAQTRARPR